MTRGTVVGGISKLCPQCGDFRGSAFCRGHCDPASTANHTTIAELKAKREIAKVQQKKKTRKSTASLQKKPLAIPEGRRAIVRGITKAELQNGYYRCELEEYLKKSVPSTVKSCSGWSKQKLINAIAAWLSGGTAALDKLVGRNRKKHTQKSFDPFRGNHSARRKLAA